MILFLLIYNDSKETLDKIQTFDASCSKSLYVKVTLCPNNCYVITKDQFQEKLLFDIIERIEESKVKNQCLHEFKNLLLKDKFIKSQIQPFSLKQVLKPYEEQNLNLSKPITIKELKIHIENQNLLEESNSILISQLQELENLVSSLEYSKPPNQSPPSSPKLSLENQNHGSFLSVTHRIDFQKSYIIFVTDFKLRSIAMLKSDANINCTQEGLIPSKYFEKTKEKMTNAIISKFQIYYKPLNAYIHCFRNVFIFVKI